MGQAKNFGDPFTFGVKPIRRDTDYREPHVLARSVLRSCSDATKSPPGHNDCVDLSVPDLLFPPFRPHWRHWNLLWKNLWVQRSLLLSPIVKMEEHTVDTLASLVAPLPNDSPESQPVTREHVLDKYVTSTFTSASAAATFFDDIEKDMAANMEAVNPEAFTTPPGGSDSNTSSADILVITQDDETPDSTAPELSSETAGLLHDTFGSLRDSDGDPCVINYIIDHHHFDKSLLQLELHWSNGTKTWAPFSIVKKDEP